MLRFFLRLFLCMVAAIVAALLTVPKLFETAYTAEADVYYHDAVRGQFHTLVEALRPLSRTERAQHLAALAPHYGLGLALVEPDASDATAAERERLAAGRYVGRNDHTDYLVPIPATASEPAQWLHVTLPSSPAISGRMWIATIAVVAAIVAAFLLAWVWPTWRDLETLKAAAQRMGAGDLHARVDVSARSNVLEVAARFNTMAGRIAELVERQRELVNAVSHELRTPIARLTFALEIVANEADAGARDTLVRGMRDDVRELDALVAELLAHARLERRDVREPLQTLPARRWLDDVLATVARDAASAGIACRVVGEPPATVALDPHAMTRALVNLVRNAIRHAASTIEVALVYEAPGYVLVVDDDGPGIAPADRMRVFEPFTRLDDSRDRETGGFGLGLAIVASVAQWHGGTVAIDDAPLGGARFSVRWNAD